MNDLFSEADLARTTHLLLHFALPPSAVTYKCIDSPFGHMLLGETPDGLCWSSFTHDKTQGVDELQAAFPVATVKEGTGMWLRKATRIMADPLRSRDVLCFHVQGSGFRMAVWRHLLDLPFGSLTSYGEIAQRLGAVNYARAVGSAVAANTIAFFIPCHRVVNASGNSGHFRWGEERKKALIAWESKLTSPTSGLSNY
jgi:AraC family transcriptional regulator of adaptative response/methylated-DNA-[protein]-cysteine methyltransferase